MRIQSAISGSDSEERRAWAKEWHGLWKLGMASYSQQENKNLSPINSKNWILLPTQKSRKKILP